MKQLHHACLCRPLSTLLLAHLAQVTPGAKHRASPAQHHDTYVSVLLESVKMDREAGHHGAVDGVALFGAIQGEGCDTVLDRAEDFVSHSVSHACITYHQSL